jgi:hypothetical protein
MESCRKGLREAQKARQQNAPNRPNSNFVQLQQQGPVTLESGKNKKRQSPAGATQGRAFLLLRTSSNYLTASTAGSLCWK